VLLLLLTLVLLLLLSLQALALLESCVGFALEHLGKLPVAQARVATRGLDCEFTHLDLGGLKASRTDVDLAMLGVRLPRRGARVCTPMGTGRVHRFRKRTRCFVIHLDWGVGLMRGGAPVRGYFQPEVR
jgi:hypothetical protein